MCKPSGHHQGIYKHQESSPPLLIPRRFLYDDKDNDQKLKYISNNTHKRISLDYPSPRLQPKPIKPIFHRVKPIVLPIMQQYPTHAVVTPAVLYKNNVREKHFIRCVDVTSRKYVINKPIFEYGR